MASRRASAWRETTSRRFPVRSCDKTGHATPDSLDNSTAVTPDVSRKSMTSLAMGVRFFMGQF